MTDWKLGRSGSAPDPKIQSDFNALGSHLSDENAAFIFQYDEPLSHLIYAGADMVSPDYLFQAFISSLSSCVWRA
jgi:starch synthase